MKLSCDLCGGELQMMGGGKSACCTTCGLGHSMDRLREKLKENGIQSASSDTPTVQTTDPAENNPKPQAEPTDVPAANISQPQADPTDVPAENTPQPQKEPDDVPAVNIEQPVIIPFDLPEPEIPDIDFPEKDIRSVSISNPIPAAPGDKPIRDVNDSTDDAPVAHSIDFTAPQFEMSVKELGFKSGFDIVKGVVKQGGIGIGDAIYFDDDYTTPYRVYLINDDEIISCVKPGMKAQLHIKIPLFKTRKLRKSKKVTGCQKPLTSAYNYPGTVSEYFTTLFASEFPQYDIQTNVQYEESELPVNFLFLQNGKPVLAVFLIHSGDNKSRTKAEKTTKRLVLKGVPCTHFFKNYRNDAPYVVDRVKKALG